jgi:hypothetical protein
VLDELNQLVKVVPLVLRHSSGEGTRETGLKELYASPLNHCLQNWCLLARAISATGSFVISVFANPARADCNPRTP